MRSIVRLHWRIAVLAVGLGCQPTMTPKPKPSTGPLTIVTTFFPIDQFTRNVVGDTPNIKIKLLLPPQLGCPHDYDLQPGDLKLLSKADILIVNGAGLDDFDVEMIKKTNPRINIINSSEGIKLIEPPAVAKKPEAEPHVHKDGHAHHHHHHHHHHDHDGANPHFFSSPRHAAQQVRNIAAGLGKVDPDHASIYQSKGADFAKQLDAIADRFRAVVKEAKNKKIVTMHDVFDYLAQDCGLELAGTVQSAAGHDPSSKEMADLITQLKKTPAAGIFVEPQYDAKVADIIAKATGIPVELLDPVATGPADAEIGYYLATMTKNLETLLKTLQAKHD